MKWLLIFSSWQILLLLGVEQKAAASEVPLGRTDAPSSRRQRGTKIGPSAAASEPDGVTSPSLKDYWFKTGVEDAERGFMQGRAETKRGDQVLGSYQYSDGNVKVKVVYAADDDGYRVLKEERVTLKPFTKSEEPYPKPDVKPKKPKGKPRRPGGHKQQPNGYKHPKIKPNFPRYQPDAFQGNSPNAFSSGSATSVFSGSNPDIFSSNGPDVFSGGSQSVFSGNKPDFFASKKPDVFLGDKPDPFPGKSPESDSNKPESTNGKLSASYSGGPQGLKLPSLEGLDGYSVKLRTNHGSGYSVQGFVSSPGKPQKVWISKSGQSTPVDDSNSGNPSSSDDDQFNHSLESRDEFSRPSAHSGRPMRESRPKPKGRKRLPNPPIDPNVVLFKPHSPRVPKPKSSKRSPFFRPAQGLRL